MANQGVTFEVDVGDISFHSGLCLHSGHPNKSYGLCYEYFAYLLMNREDVRKVMSIIYYADGLVLQPADNRFKQLDLDAFWTGVKPGQLAASPDHPLLFPILE
jgi:hypothetical protein